MKHSLKKAKLLLSSLLIFILLISNMKIISNADEGTTSTSYTVKQITSESELEYDSLYDYIIVYDVEGTLVALNNNQRSTKASSSHYDISSSNTTEITLNSNTLTYSTDENILWYLTKDSEIVYYNESNNTNFGILACKELADSKYSDRIYLNFYNSTDSSKTGLNVCDSSYHYDTFEFDENGNVIISQDDIYLRYSSHKDCFTIGDKDEASLFKIYRVEKSYPTKSSYNYDLTNATWPNPGSINLNKTASEIKYYSSTGVADINLTVQAKKIIKEVDFMLILDDSKSVNNETLSDGRTRAQYINDQALMFSNLVLSYNPNNRVGVVKFGSIITNQELAESTGLTNDIDKITNMINVTSSSYKGGTNFTLAFEEANKILANTESTNRDTVIIFISDGVPTIYNRYSYDIFDISHSLTTEGTAKTIGEAWGNYISTTELYENKLAKNANIKIYSIGSKGEDDYLANNTSDKYKVSSSDIQTTMKNLATEEAYFYDWNKIDTELTQILTDISNKFYLFPYNASVNDSLSSDIKLLNKNLDIYTPEIVFKNGETELEKITFNQSGTEAYSSLLEGNILTTDSNGAITITGKYFSFDEAANKITWTLGDLTSDEVYTLDYVVYLTQTSNLYNDGNTRLTGEYNISTKATLSYDTPSGENTEVEYNKVALKWTAPSSNNSVPSSTPSQPATNVATTTALYTGDNLVIINTSIIMIIILLNLIVTKFVKGKKVLKKKSRLEK